MLCSLKHLYGDKLGASDGDIGQVKDFYFDDQSWAIRYVVADTGAWLPGRQVLLSPYAFGLLNQAKKPLRVKLTRKQIEKSPSIDTHKPVSRQYEEEYYRYFGWPYYWEGSALWGLSGFPILELPPRSASGQPGNLVGPQPKGADAHLHSARAMDGYHLVTAEGILGHVCDFMVDTGSWAISQLVIKSAHRLVGHEMLIPVQDVERISYEESTVFATPHRHVMTPKPAPRAARAAA